LSNDDPPEPELRDTARRLTAAGRPTRSSGVSSTGSTTPSNGSPAARRPRASTSHWNGPPPDLSTARRNPLARIPKID